jgi:hypothetical protein
MEQLQRHYKATNKALAVQVLESVGTGWDEYREARLPFEDGQSFRAGFWRDPGNRGKHWWEETGMAIVQDLTTERILSAVDEALELGMVGETFEPYPS